MWEFPMPPVKTADSPRLVKNLARRRVGSKKRRTFLYRCEWDDDTWSLESSKALEEDPVYIEFLLLHPESLHFSAAWFFEKLMRGSRSTSGASAYGTTPRTS